MSADHQHRDNQLPGAAPAPTPARHRRSRTVRRAFLAVGVLAVLGAAAAVPLYADASTRGVQPVMATGDTRHVAQPTLPTVCATVGSTLAMPARTASAAQEATPPDTARIQRAIDGCAQSGAASVAVKLTSSGANTDFLTGPLTLGRGVVLLLDSGVTLHGSRNAADYQVSGRPRCGTVAAGSGGCPPLVSVAGANAGIEAVRAATGAQGRIDGRGDLAVLGTLTTWWDLAHQAQVTGGNQNNPRLIQAVNSDNFTLYDVDLLNSPNFHVVYQGGNGFTAWGVRIKTPADARNTDGIDPAGSTNVTINDSYIQTGDDGVAIKGGSAASNMTIENSHFYGTHGISIGSETNGGVSNILFRNNTLTGTDSSGIVSGSSAGIRIKSSAKNGGKVSDVSYLNTCLSAVRAPLVFDTHYSGDSGSSIPQFTGILVDGVTSVASPAGAASVFQGYSAALPLGLTLENVHLDVVRNTAQYAAISTAHTNLVLSGTGVRVTPTSAGGAAPSCSFPRYPDL